MESSKLAYPLLVRFKRRIRKQRQRLEFSKLQTECEEKWNKKSRQSYYRVCFTLTEG